MHCTLPLSADTSTSTMSNHAYYVLSIIMSAYSLVTSTIGISPEMYQESPKAETFPLNKNKSREYCWGWYFFFFKMLLKNNIEIKFGVWKILRVSAFLPFLFYINILHFFPNHVSMYVLKGRNRKPMAIGMIYRKATSIMLIFLTLTKLSM